MPQALSTPVPLQRVSGAVMLPRDTLVVPATAELAEAVARSTPETPGPWVAVLEEARALGDLARTQTSLDLAGAHTDAAAEDRPAAREVVVHAHFDASFSGDATVFGPTGRMENGQRLVLLAQIRSWCADTRTEVTIKPVIDLNASLTAQGYKVPADIREQIQLRDRTCVFPGCARPARRCDVDHIVPWDDDAEAEGRPQPGPTATWNLACLCRFHHRLKTHSPWRYEMTAPGTFEWTSPHGHRYRRDHTGTTDLDPLVPDETPAQPPGIPRPRRR